MNTADGYRDWIGKHEEAPTDQITPRLIASLQATLDGHLSDGQAVPPGMHWCLAPPTVSGLALGPDGHPAKGGFLPPIPLPRRMWAGGTVEFLAPLEPGDQIKRTSIIQDISAKTGRSGPLCFVTVAHSYATPSGTAIRETQNIVYRKAATQRAPLPGPVASPKKCDITREFAVTSVTLFRYSALTFNGHRIHYDLAYAQDTEFYPDLVIHGPLQATLLLNLATSINKKLPSHFSYRGTAPATGAQTLLLGANPTKNGCDLEIQTENGITSMTASAKW